MRHRKTILFAFLGASTVAIVAVLAAGVSDTGDKPAAKATPAAAEPVAAPVQSRTSTPPPRKPSPSPAASPAAPSASPAPTAQPFPSREEMRRERMARFDKDRNGELDDTERETMRKERLADEFQRLDANGDGVLSLEEFQAAQGRRFGAFGRGRRGGAP